MEPGDQGPLQDFDSRDQDGDMEEDIVTIQPSREVTQTSLMDLDNASDNQDYHNTGSTDHMDQTIHMIPPGAPA